MAVAVAVKIYSGNMLWHEVVVCTFYIVCFSLRGSCVMKAFS